MALPVHCRYLADASCWPDFGTSVNRPVIVLSRGNAPVRSSSVWPSSFVIVPQNSRSQAAMIVPHPWYQRGAGGAAGEAFRDGGPLYGQTGSSAGAALSWSCACI